jgi:ATP-binding protein involved in chromosome partitioning
MSVNEERVLLPAVSHVVAVGSGKGGVGKSTVAANLALSLARAGARVGLMDADVYGPNLPLMLGVSALPRPADGAGKIQPVEAHGLKLMSMGFFLREDEPVIWRGPMVHGVVQQFLGDVLWGALDYLVIDLPPGTGDVQLTLSQAVPLSGALVVTTPQDVALLDARKAIAMFTRAGVPILGIIENMSAFVCPHCGGATEIFGAGGGRRMAGRLGVPLFGSIPLDPALMRASDSGRPLGVISPDCAQAQAFLRLAQDVAARLGVVGLEHGRPLVDSRPQA